MRTIHAGRILLQEKTICEALGYPGGILRHFSRNDCYLALVIVIEHPSMPEVQEFDEIPIVNNAVFNLLPETYYVASGGLVRRLRESFRAFMAVWKFYSKEV